MRLSWKGVVTLPVLPGTLLELESGYRVIYSVYYSRYSGHGDWSPDRRLGLHRQSLHRPQVLGPATEQRSDLPRYPGTLLVLTLDTGYNV